MSDHRPVLVDLDAAGFRVALPVLLSIYVTAMGYPPSTGHARASLWLQHSGRSGFRCVAAVGVPEDPAAPTVVDETAIIGFGYGYQGRRGQWWYDEVRRGLTQPSSGSRADAAPPGTSWLADFFELTELHVLPAHQGAGIGEELLRRLLAPVPAAAVLLSTPEGTSRAWRLYRRLGFVDVLRDFRFTGDGRPFAVLGRRLPLPPTDPGSPAPP